MPKAPSVNGAILISALFLRKFKDSWHGLSYLMDRVPHGLDWLIEPHGMNPKEFNNKYSTLATEVKEHGIKV